MLQLGRMGPPDGAGRIGDLRESYVSSDRAKCLLGRAQVSLSISFVLLLSAEKLLANQLVGDIHRTESNFGCHKLDTLFVPADWPPQSSLDALRKP